MCAILSSSEEQIKMLNAIGCGSLEPMGERILESTPPDRAQRGASLFSRKRNYCAVTVIVCAAVLPFASYAFAWIVCDVPGFAGTFQG